MNAKKEFIAEVMGWYHYPTAAKVGHVFLKCGHSEQEYEDFLDRLESVVIGPIYTGVVWYHDGSWAERLDGSWKRFERPILPIEVVS